MFVLADLNLGPPAAFSFIPSPFATLPGPRLISFVLPEEVLRQILECAAYSDRRTALTLAHLSRTVQSWIDEIIYAQVHLSYPRTVDLFLRTLYDRPLSTIKPESFLENAVRSLFVCSDAEPESVLAILSVCRSVNDFSYWARPRGQPHILSREAVPHANGRRSSLPTHTTQHLRSFDPHKPLYARPNRISLLFHDSQPLSTFGRHTFDIPLFSAVTHLSVVNKWEEWTAWAGSGIGTEAMRSLTHLKFDFAVGQAPPDSTGAQGSRSRWLDTVTNIRPIPRDKDTSEDVDMDKESCREDSTVHLSHSAWTTKMETVAGAVSDVLNNHPSLKVCVLILRFDTNPAGTAKIISRLASQKFKANPNPGSRPSGILVGETGSETPSQLGFDPRLVFAWEKEPFRYSYAHSVHEGMIWKSAEAVAKAQRYLSGYTILNCDCLI
ncbi:hypothetical protein GALMADRAFT_782309 [Galerina marginata CBS 339.88]|uniref:F-box domain-containing protein n=1 Tax=Galerina marginata (strain CBS 339.88) TaxID=685588 RepID=A0A067SP76_GALM3|nr:hypothetical protein GALMADRAFT_782309 [Galerina marginata CBS 339.88]